MPLELRAFRVNVDFVDLKYSRKEKHKKSTIDY